MRRHCGSRPRALLSGEPCLARAEAVALRVVLSSKPLVESRTRSPWPVASSHISLRSRRRSGAALDRSTMSLFHEVHDTLPSLPPVTTFALVEMLRRQDISELRQMQFARVEWFEPVPDADGERGVGPDALRVGLSALIDKAKQLPAVASIAGDEPPLAPAADECAPRSRSRRRRRWAAKCADLAAECGAVRDLELAINIARQCAIAPRAGPRREVVALRQGWRGAMSANCQIRRGSPPFWAAAQRRGPA